MNPLYQQFGSLRTHHLTCCKIEMIVRSCAVRAVAVTSLKRSTLAPDIPTTAGVGLSQLAFGAGGRRGVRHTWN
jgi:tripartite-type tricarboxylate transporter receptor subunit TctC